MKTHLLIALFLLGFTPVLAVAGTIPNEDAQKRTAETIVAFSTDHDIGKAKAGYKAALKLDPNYAPARYGLGLMLEAEEDWKGAREAFQQVVKNPKSGSFSAVAKAELADIEKTTNALKTPEDRKRLAYDDLIAQARLLLRSKQIPEAAKRAAEARKLDDSRWEAYMVAGEAMQSAGRVPEAILFFNAAAKRAPGLYKENLAGVARELQATEEEAALWKKVESGNDKSAMETYLIRYPSGRHFAEASAMLKSINEREERAKAERQRQEAEAAAKQKQEAERQRQQAEVAEARRRQEAERQRQQAEEARKGYVSQGGLTWMPATFTKIWADANAYCTSFKGLGQNGWRLPTRNELSALYNSGAMKGQGWTLSGTWSSTPSGNSSHYGVRLNNDIFGWTRDTDDIYVTCVR